MGAILEIMTTSRKWLILRIPYGLPKHIHPCKPRETSKFAILHKKVSGLRKIALEDKICLGNTVEKKLVVGFADKI